MPGWYDREGILHESDDEPDENGGNDFVVKFDPEFDLSEHGILNEAIGDAVKESNPDIEDNSISDIINPFYYKNSPMECIEAIEGLKLSFHEAQILKYIYRWRNKNGVEDLKKARWYLERLIKLYED